MIDATLSPVTTTPKISIRNIDFNLDTNTVYILIYEVDQDGNILERSMNNKSLTKNISDFAGISMDDVSTIKATILAFPEFSNATPSRELAQVKLTSKR